MIKNKKVQTLRDLTVWVMALAIALLVVIPLAQAQSYGRSFELISELNRLDPEQNRAYEDSKDVLGRRVLDRKNKVIGEVRDIVLNDGGSIELLSVEFNRLRFNTNIFLNYGAMRIETVSDGYAMGFDADQIEQLYPTLLAEMSTAAGNEDIFSVRTVIGGAVKGDEGRKIGVVEDVLFGSNGSRAEAILVRLTQGTLRGDKVALPFNNPRFEQAGGSKNIIISNDMAKAVVDFAKSN